MDEYIELRCSRCNEYKPLDDFYKDHRSGKKRHGRSYTCRYCAAESRAGENVEEWRQMHLEELKEIFSIMGYDTSQMDSDPTYIHQQFMKKLENESTDIPPVKKLTEMTQEEKREYWNNKRYNYILKKRKKDL